MQETQFHSHGVLEMTSVACGVELVQRPQGTGFG